jgi:signal transduction histidine kinase
MSVLSRRSAVFLFFVIAGVPVALLTYLSIAVSTASAMDQAEKGVGDSAKASAVFIRQRFSDVSGQLDSFAQGSLAPAMAGPVPGRYDTGRIAAQLADLTRVQGRFNSAFVTDPRGRLIAITPADSALVGRYFSGDDWYQGASSRDGPYISGLSPTAVGQKLSSVAIAAPIHSTAGPRLVGYLVGLYSLDQIQAFVADFARTRGTNLSVVDGAGFVLAAPGLTPGTVTSWPAGDRMLQAALAGHESQSQVTLGGSSHIAAYAPVVGCGWAVVADVPSSAALGMAAQLRTTVLAIAAVLGVVLIAGLVIGQTLVHRAQQSAVFQQRMESLARLNEAARSVHADHGPRALQVIATSARELLGADFSALGVWDGARARMEPVAHDGSPDLPAAGLGDLAALLVERCRPPSITAGRGELGDLVLAGDGAQVWGLGPFLSVPLVAGDRVLGSLMVCRRWRAPDFHAVNEGQLQQMAQHAISVLENTRRDAEREAFLDRLSETNDELELANRLKSQFLARMSHELRTPLSAIIGFSDLLLEGASGELNGEQRDDVQEIGSAGRLLLDVINDILDLSRIEAGRMPLEMRPIRLGALLTDVASALRPLALAKALELRLEVESDDPPVTADPLRIRQVVTNLVSNAIKFTHEGGVTIHLRARSGGAEVSVVDTGVGIPNGALRAVFDEFTQVDGGTTRGFAGTGLGLSIAQRLVELHEGTIGVDSEVGVGSRFWFWLPVAAGAAEPHLVALPAGEGVAR